MAPRMCDACGVERPALQRPKTRERLCRACFFAALEDEVHDTIVSNALFRPGERVAVAASGAWAAQHRRRWRPALHAPRSVLAARQPPDASSSCMPAAPTTLLNAASTRRRPAAAPHNPPPPLR